MLFSLANLIPGTVYDIFRKPQLARDRKCITLAGDPNKEPVGGRQCLNVELTACIAYPVLAKGIDLKLTVVGGRCCPNPLLMKVIKDGRCKCRTLRGIGTGTKLIKKAQ